MEFTAIDSTGEISAVLEAADEATAALNTPAGCSLVDGAPGFEACWWDGKQWVQKPARPQPFDTWDTAAKAWVDVRTLDDVKAQRRGLIEGTRDALAFSTFAWGGSTFRCDGDSQQRVMGAVQLAILAKGANQAYSVTWTLADETTRVLSGDDVISMGLALGAFMQANFAKCQALVAQIAAATTTQQVEAIVWA